MSKTKISKIQFFQVSIASNMFRWIQDLLSQRMIYTKLKDTTTQHRIQTNTYWPATSTFLFNILMNDPLDALLSKTC